MAVDQGQGTSGAEAAQVDRRTAGAAAVVDVRVEHVTCDGRQRLQQVADGQLARLLDLGLVDSDDRIGCLDVDATDVRTRHGDRFQLLAAGVVLRKHRSSRQADYRRGAGVQRIAHGFEKLVAHKIHYTLQRQSCHSSGQCALPFHGNDQNGPPKPSAVDDTNKILTPWESLSAALTCDEAPLGSMTCANAAMAHRNIAGTCAINRSVHSPPNPPDPVRGASLRFRRGFGPGRGRGTRRETCACRGRDRTTAESRLKDCTAPNARRHRCDRKQTERWHGTGRKRRMPNGSGTPAGTKNGGGAHAGADPTSRRAGQRSWRYWI